MDSYDLKTVYSNMIAGRLPVGGGNPQKVVMNQAYAILGTHRLHAFFVERAGYVYYFAVESRYLSSALNFRLPFSEVLPGGPLHMGDAIYQLTGSDYSVALVIEGGSLRLLCNEIDVLKDYLIGLDLEIVEVKQSGGQSLRSIPQAIQGITERFSAILMKSSLGVLIASGLVFTGTQMARAYNLSKNESALNSRAVENDLNATLGKLSIQQPLARQLSRIQSVSAAVIRSGGWIERYQMRGENDESFELILPSWVSQDYLDSLGRDVITDLRDMEGLLTVRKNGKRESAS